MKEYRHQILGLADLLNYALMVDDGIVLLKDGSFCAGMQYQGMDMHSMQPSDLALIRSQMNQILCQLGDGWMVHADMIRSKAVGYLDSSRNSFPDATSFMIDEERRHYFLNARRHYESRYYFVFTFKPPVEVESRFKKYFIDDQKISTGWEQVLTLFIGKINQLENSFSKFLTINRLGTSELLSHLHHCLTGVNFAIKHPFFTVYLDQLLGAQDFLGGFSPQIGAQHIRVLGLNGFPLESQVGMLQNMADLPIAFRWSNRFIFLDAASAAKELKKYRRYWFQKRHGLMGLVREIFNAQQNQFYDQDAVEMASDADSAVHEAESSLVKYGYYTSNFILLDENLGALDASLKLLRKQLESQGFSSRIETVNAVEAYIGSLPGHGYQNIRKPLLYTINFADLLPLAAMWQGSNHNPCPYYPEKSPPLFYAQTNGGTPFRCSLHIGDVGHTLVIGDTGSGKSTLLSFLMTQHLRYSNAQIFMFDKGYSNFTLCHALKGTHYDLGSGLSFSPLKNIDQDNELDWACEWLESLFASQNLSISTVHRKEIRESLLRLRKQFSKTLTDLQATLQIPD